MIDLMSATWEELREELALADEASDAAHAALVNGSAITVAECAPLNEAYHAARRDGDAILAECERRGGPNAEAIFREATARAEARW